MQFYPQLLLWTYVLLPAISLLLSPTFFIALARAQQQRAKIMTNALAARGRAAAALARANQRRYLPRYSNGFAQFKPFKMRPKRELDMGVPDIGIDEKPREADMLERKSHWDQQEESLGQLENMWNMNNFGISQNEGVRSMHDNRPEKSTEDIVGDPFMHSYSAKNRNRNDKESDYYAGAFSGRNVFDGVLEQSEQVSLTHDESESLNTDETVESPDPTFKKLKKKLNKKQEPHQQNYYNYYYPQYSHGSSYGSPYGRSDETEANPQNGVMETEDTLEKFIGDPSNTDERVESPDPTFKKLKKKLNKKQEPHHQNHYNYYYPQYSHGSSYGSPYGRSDETEANPQNGVMETEDTLEKVIGGPVNPDERVGDPDPTFKKLKKKLNKKQEPHQQNYYNYYYPQYSHSSSYGSPYGRSDETEAHPQNGVLEIEDTLERVIGRPVNPGERVGDPDPTFKKLKKKLNKKQESPQQNYYNYYYPQYSHSSSYGSPYGRSDETEAHPQNGVLEIEDTLERVIGGPVNPDERVGDPDPTFKKLKKKLNKKQEPHQQNYYNYYYYPQYSHGSSYGYPYGRSHAVEAMSQNGELEIDDRLEAIINDSSNTEDRVGIPEPTFKKLKKKEMDEEHHPYPYPQNHYNPQYSPYPGYYRNAETEDMHQNGAIIDDMAMINGKESFHVTDPTLGEPEPQYNPYSRASQRGKMLQNMEEHEMDNFMMGQLVLPRFANPEPTFKKKKDTSTTIEHMPHSFYYPQNQYNSYYSPSIYSDAYHNPYTRSTELVAQNDKVTSLDKQVGDPFEEEQKSANPEPHHSHKKIEKAHSGGEQNFFYSSNFYERDNEAVEDSASEAKLSKQETSAKLETPLNKEEQADVPKDTDEPEDEPKILGVKETLNSPKASEHIPTFQEGERGTEDVGCGLDEKIEKKLAKKLKKLLKKDKEEPNTNKMEYSVPPMYSPPKYSPPMYSPSPSYGGEYEQPEYYRSASESDKVNENNKQAVKSQTITDAIKDEKKKENKNKDHYPPSMNPPSSAPGQPGSYRSTPNAGNSEKDNKQQAEIQKNINEPMVAPIDQHFAMPFREFPGNVQEPEEEFHLFEERFNPTNGQNDRIDDRPINVAPHTMENSRSASYLDHVHDNPEDVGCELDDNLLDPDNAMRSFDPYAFYQRAVDGISEESRNIADKAKQILEPKHQTPAMIKPTEPAMAYVDFDELSKHGYQANENPQSDLLSFDRVEPSREKSADPNANPHLSHSHGSTHTHTHFISHTHGHDHQKGLSKLHGGQGIHPINSKVFPHHHGHSNSGFSQANANAQSFNHGGHHSTIAQANSKTFGNSFGSNSAIAQSNAQAFNGGQINNFGSNSHAGADGFHGGQFNDFIPNSAIAKSGAQGFNNGGFGHSATSAGSFIQNGQHLLPNAAIAQSQALTNGGFGQSAASANSLIQNGQHFAPNAAFAQSQAHNNGGFGQSAAHASAQSGLGGNIGPQTFQHGFENPHGLAFNNNPGQFASSSANAQIVGQRHEKELFVMPHLEELPIKHLFTEMKSGTHRLPRSSQGFQEDVFGGVRLASGIVDASLDRNSALDGAGQQRSSDEPQDMQGTMGYVAHIVDSSIRTGESNTQRGSLFKTPTPRYPESESARGLAIEGISSITDLVSKGLRVKRHDAFEGLELASGIVDASLDRNSALDGAGQQRSSDEPQDMQGTMGYVAHIVDSSIRAGESNTQRGSLFKTPTPRYPESESARGLAIEGISSITDLVSKGLRVKRHDAFEGLELASGIVDASLDRNSALDGAGQQRSSDASQDMQGTMGYVAHIVDSSIRTGESSTQKSTSSKTNSLESQSARGLVGKEVSAITDLVSKGLGVKRQIVSENNNNFEELFKDTDKDEIIRKQIPEQVFKKNDETDHLSLVVNKKADHHRNASEAPISENNDVENAEVGSRGQEKIVLRMANPDTVTFTPDTKTNQPEASDNKNKAVIYVTPVSTDLPIENDSSKLQINASKNKEENRSAKVLLTNPNTENTNVLTNDDDITAQTLDSITKSDDNDKQIITRAPNKLHSNMDSLQKDEITTDIAKSGSFLGVRNEDSVKTGLVETNNDTSRNNQDNLKLNDSNLIRDEEATLVNTAALLPYFLFANGTRKNISDLTSDEIQELQFDLPNNSTEGNIYITPDSKSTSGEIIGIPQMTNKSFNAKLDDNTKESNKKYNDFTLPNSKLSDENISKSNQDNSSQISEIPVSQHEKDSIQKIIFDMSEGPFASIEAEMGILTEEEKEAFIKQEVALIKDVIEETFRHHNVDGASLNRTSETPKNKTSDAKDTSESTEKVVTSPNLFQAHGRESGREEYSRQVQSNENKENEKTFNDILGEHREKVEKIKHIAADEDEDLLMISFIGDSVLKDLESRQNKSGEVSGTNHSHTNQSNQTNNEAIEINETNPINFTYPINHTTGTNVTDDAKKVDEIPLNRTKREISGIRSSRTPLTQLISDPTTKLDVEKTLQNLGSIARHTFENPRAPMYHVRNMLGNAKNSVMSAASVPPNNFLIPSKYEIAKIARNKELNGEKVGAVNRNNNMLLSRSGFGNSGEDEEDSLRNFNGNSIGLEDTVQKLGGMVRESVQRGKDAVEHVNNVAADAKKFLQTSKHTVPRLIVPRPKQNMASRASFDPLVGSVHRDKPILKKHTLIVPKIFDLQENIIGTAQENPENFVGVGHILDAAGLSQPNQPEVQLQKIKYEPLNHMNLRPVTIPSKLMTKNAKKPPKKYDVKKEGKDQNAFLGAVEQAAVTENLRDFMQRMHDEMKEIVKSQYEERKRQRLQRTMKPRTKPAKRNKTDFSDFKKTTRQTILQNQIAKPNILGASNSYYNARKNLKDNEEMEISPEVIRDNEDGGKSELNIPVVFSRMQANTKFDKSPLISYAEKYPYQEQYVPNTLRNENTDNDETVQLFLPENLMKPFMGQPSESEIQEYMRLNGDEENFERESSDVPKQTPEISDISKLINLNKPLAKVESLSPLSYRESIVPMRRKSPKIPLSLELSKISPFSAANPERSFLPPELVGAVMPKAIVNKVNSTTSPDIAEKTKEFVELLSDPEIEDSESPETNQNISSSSLDSNMHNLLAEPESTSNTLNIESSLQKTVTNSSSKTNKNVDHANTNISTVKNGREEKSQNLENAKQKAPSSNFKMKSLTVGRVPDQNDLGYVLGAINPMMFERHFNERLQINDTSSQDTHNTFLNQGIVMSEKDDSTIKSNTGRPTDEENNNQSPVKVDETKDLVTTKDLQLNDNFNRIQGGNQRDKDVVEAQLNLQQEQKSDEQISENGNDLNEIKPEEGRTSMNVRDPYKKPFMGFIKKDKMNKFLNQYNNNLPEETDNEQHEEYAENESYKQNIEPVKNVVFSSIEGEDDYNNYAY